MKYLKSYRLFEKVEGLDVSGEDLTELPELPDTLKKLFSQYGSKNVKETLKSIIDEKVLEKTWEEYKKAA